MKRRTGRRALTAVGAAGLAISLVATVPAAPAVADTSRGSAYSAAGQVGTANGLQVKTSTSGLLIFLQPVLAAVLDPLLSTVTSVIPSVVGQLTSTLVGGTGLSATNNGTTVPTPTNGVYPTCSSPWDSSDCYGTTPLSVGLPPLLNISLGSPQGYAAYDPTNGYSAGSQILAPAVSLLGISLVQAGVIQSTSQCSPTGTCTHTQSTTNLSLLGGAVTLNIANGNSLVTINNGAQSTGGNLPLQLLGNGISVSVTGNLLTAKVTLSLDSLTGMLGLSSLVGGAGASVVLTLTAGPGDYNPSGSASSWGLDLGLDLSANISIDLGLAGIKISIPTGITGSNYGNLLDLKLGYTSATAKQQTTGGTWFPPGLT